MFNSVFRFAFPLVGFPVLLFAAATTGRIAAEEGMFPMSELRGMDLSSRGIQLTADELFNPSGVSLVDGICRVNGCTGSFVSPDGLLITNHHCAYDAIQQASRPDRDLLADGFQARTRAEEIPAPDYVVRITEDYSDVSEAVLKSVQPGMDFAERTKAIRQRSRELELEAEQRSPGLRAEVAEMFAGKTYVLFLYTYLRDVRLVFAPPASVGNFGGDVDNWEWPRHTGDFSFMRAYTAPDGSSATYDAGNIPYRPKRFVRVNPAGVNEGDAVFLLGYPGRTARHKTASFLNYEQNYRLPAIVDLYAWQIAEMSAAGASDRSVEIKMSARIKSLANVEKRSRGQLQGLRRAQIMATRAAEEEALKEFISRDSARTEKYGEVLSGIAEVYAEMERQSALELNLAQLRSAPRLAAVAWFLVDAAAERGKPDLERETAYTDKNFEQSVQGIRSSLNDVHAPTDKVLMRGLVERLKAIPEAARIVGLDRLLGEPELVDTLIDSTRVGDPEFVEAFLSGNTSGLLSDPLISLMSQLHPVFAEQRELDKQREGKLSELYGKLVEVKQELQKTSFVPDANSTLRFTCGRVRSYSPADGIIKTPVSTFRGVIEKTTGVDPFITPKEVMAKWNAGDFGNYLHPQLGEIPVAILYDTDTTGGNSGSPVFNGQGELVGVNFDRCFEATINDFAWNTSYSRSIGVDIRYVLWITGTVYGADHIVSEMMSPETN